MEFVKDYQYLTNINLKTTVISQKGLTLVLFVMEGSGSCYLMERSLSKLPEKIRKQISIFRMDYEANKEAALAYGIHNTPTILFFQEGQLIDQVMGLSSKKELISRIQSNL